MADDGAGVLFVTHDVLEAVLLSNRVLMMSSRGRYFATSRSTFRIPRQQTEHEVVTLQADILELFEVMEEEASNGSAKRSPGAADGVPATG